MKKIFLLLTVISFSLYAKTQTIVFGAGCFWGVEKHFEDLDGVINASVGYAGGDYKNPTYKEVVGKRFSANNHIEVVEVVYDDKNISTESLIKSFWELHDPTQGNRQGNDKGSNYRSAIFYTNNTQKEIALKTKESYQVLLNKAGYSKITTQIEPLKKFYRAELYHQDYLKNNPKGYCPNHSTGVKFKKNNQKSKIITPIGGKEIIVIDADYCPFCEKFKTDVTNNYKGTIPLRTAKESELKGFKIVNKIEGTPTILLIEDGEEIYSKTGYMDEKKFYQFIAEFKLGSESEAFNVAFNQNTDNRFCKQYKLFQNVEDGFFIDKISGDILFDTRDRFDSGSGWLSFFKAVDGATIQKEDNSFGMKRVEIIAKKSGAHLGHIFNDAPNGQQRFCINATVLEFVPRLNISIP